MLIAIIIVMQDTVFTVVNLDYNVALVVLLLSETPMKTINYYFSVTGPFAIVIFHCDIIFSRSFLMFSVKIRTLHHGI